MKKVLIVAATSFEIQPFLNYLTAEIRQKQSVVFRNYEFDVLITGVGMVNTALKLTKRLTQNTYDFVLNAGVAGSRTVSITSTGIAPWRSRSRHMPDAVWSTLRSTRSRAW